MGDWVIVFRYVIALALLTFAATQAFRVYRRTSRADMILTLLMCWFVHGIIILGLWLIYFIVNGSRSEGLAFIFDWWSALYLYQIILALIIILIRHPKAR